MLRLFADLAIAHGNARYPRLLRSIVRAKLLIPDDWEPEALRPEQARDLLEIVEERVLDRAAPHRSQERHAVAGPG
ncbi:hypothetical protein CH337_17010 [Rhodoblastus acidophilus]|nr:hypothetical protein CKO16_14805 [Rhodoblastus acidophilus]RAI17311.1 hypothetical protein CH337_17010 [Rhodoblastus acidophilus]